MVTRDSLDPVPGTAPRGDRLPVDFTAFHKMHRPGYVKWAQTYLHHRDDAEEAVDRAFEQLLMVWPKVLSQRSPAAYAWRVMKNRMIDVARERGRRAMLTEAAFETVALREAVDPIGQLEESLFLYQAIQELPERQQDVVVLLFSHGLSAGQAARQLGITPAGVRSNFRHATRRLREILGLDTTGTS